MRGVMARVVAALIPRAERPFVQNRTKKQDILYLGGAQLFPFIKISYLKVTLIPSNRHTHIIPLMHNELLSFTKTDIQ